jgi:3-oxoacyl-[acyl-carrier protein] reductase
VQGAAAKAGLEAVVRVVAREEGRRGIRANAVAVGLTDTDMARTGIRGSGARNRPSASCAASRCDGSVRRRR